MNHRTAIACALWVLVLTGCGSDPKPPVGSAPKVTVRPTRIAIPVHPPVVPARAGMLSINFDDGYESAYQKALPLFDAAGVKTTQFIITGFFGRRGYVTQEQVLDEEQRGHEIASHSRTHPRLSQLSDADQFTEINGSKSDLEALLGHSVSAFAYPYGDHSDETLALVQEQGFTSGRSVDQAAQNTAQTNPFKLYSLSITDSSDMPYVLAQIGKAAADRTWLIITMHRVDEDGNPISIRHEKVQQLIQHIQRTGIETITTSEALRRLQSDAGPTPG